MAAVQEVPMKAVANILGYKVDFMDVLGHGHFGIVYKGLDRDGSSVAVKKVSLSHKQNANNVVDEARNILIMIDGYDENIVNVHEVKSHMNSMWIFMQYCDQGNLNNFFDMQKGKLNVEDKLIIKVQIAKGISFLHGRNIIHRDIKPVNILVTSRRANPVVKLADFGLSKFLDPDGLSAAMSSDVRSLTFKAPEFWQRSPDGDIMYHRNVDVYAAGLTFLAMLQTRPGRNLVPKAEGSLQPSETRMPIGLAVFSRLVQSFQKADQFIINIEQVHVVIDIIVGVKENDDEMTKEVKEIIRGMTCVNPQDRMTAAEVETKLKTVLHQNNLNINANI